MEEPIKITLDFQQKTPLTEQIRKELWRLIEKQALEPGRLLPTVRQLAAQLGVNFNTVARAYRALDAAGVITTRQGRGTYVVGLAPIPAPERRGQKEAVKERIEQFFQEAEQDGISRREIAQSLLSMIRHHRRSAKIQARQRLPRKKKRLIEYQEKPEAKPPALPKIRGVRVARKRARHDDLFHVKQPGVKKKQ